MRIVPDFSYPIQNSINIERINELTLSTPRRFQLGNSFKPLNAPRREGEDWNLFFPFQETFVPAFETVFDFDHIGFRSKRGQSCYTFLKGVGGEDIFKLEKWLNIISVYVAIKDCLAISFALDFDRIGGKPGNNRTPIGKLRERAKPYGKPVTEEVLKNAYKLAYFCFDFLGKVKCYDSCEVVVGMPPSSPDAEFILPVYLANEISEKWGRDHYSKFVKTIKERPGLKNVPLSRKLDVLEGTVKVHSKAFNGKNVLLVDDLYQSGVTMNYVAMLLLNAGAKRIFGLACEKTCRNDDNISSSQ